MNIYTLWGVFFTFPLTIAAAHHIDSHVLHLSLSLILPISLHDVLCLLLTFPFFYFVSLKFRLWSLSSHHRLHRSSSSASRLLHSCQIKSISLRPFNADFHLWWWVESNKLQWSGAFQSFLDIFSLSFSYLPRWLTRLFRPNSTR